MPGDEHKKKSKTMHALVGHYRHYRLYRCISRTTTRRGINKEERPSASGLVGCLVRRRVSPSRARRDARRRQAFLEKQAAQKGLGVGVCVGKAEEEVGGVQTGNVEERAEHVVGGDDDGGVSVDDDGGVSGDDDVSSEESGVSSDGEEVVDLAGCSRAMYEKRDGEHGVRFGVDGFGEGWTPVRRRRQKGKRDLEIGGGLRVPEGAWVDYLELQGRPGLQVQEGRVQWWEPISTRTRSRFK